MQKTNVNLEVKITIMAITWQRTVTAQFTVIFFILQLGQNSPLCDTLNSSPFYTVITMPHCRSTIKINRCTNTLALSFFAAAASTFALSAASIIGTTRRPMDEGIVSATGIFFGLCLPLPSPLPPACLRLPAASSSRSRCSTFCKLHKPESNNVMIQSLSRSEISYNQLVKIKLLCIFSLHYKKSSSERQCKCVNHH